MAASPSTTDDALFCGSTESRRRQLIRRPGSPRLGRTTLPGLRLRLWLSTRAFAGSRLRVSLIALRGLIPLVGFEGPSGILRLSPGGFASSALHLAVMIVDACQ